MSFEECLFRVDASIDIGTGHVRRCLTIADAMVKKGKKVTFITRSHEGNLIDEIKRRNYLVKELPRMHVDGLQGYQQWLGCDWSIDLAQTISNIENKNSLLIVDHYGIDQRWEKGVRPYVKKIMAIDDLGNRSHSCDFLLDQNISASAEKYSGLISDSCVMLLGTKYCLLREEFSNFRDVSLKRRSKKSELKIILITLGGVDKNNITYSILEKIKSISGIGFKVVVGSKNENYYKLLKLSEGKKNIEIIVNAENMAELMAGADLCIGAAGGTTWERCCLGLPTIQLVIADNQKEIARRLAEMGAVQYLDLHDDERVVELIETANQWMHGVSMISSSLVDGNGVSRVLEELEDEEKYTTF